MHVSYIAMGITHKQDWKKVRDSQRHPESIVGIWEIM